MSTIDIDFFKYRYDIATPAFVVLGEKFVFHRATLRLIDYPDLLLDMQAASYTPPAYEIGEDADYAWERLGIDVGFGKIVTIAPDLDDTIPAGTELSLTWDVDGSPVTVTWTAIADTSLEDALAALAALAEAEDSIDSAVVVDGNIILTGSDGNKITGGTIIVPGAPKIIQAKAQITIGMLVRIDAIEVTGSPDPDVNLTGLWQDGVDVLADAQGLEAGPWYYTTVSNGFDPAYEVKWELTATNSQGSDVRRGSLFVPYTREITGVVLDGGEMDLTKNPIGRSDNDFTITNVNPFNLFRPDGAVSGAGWSFTADAGTHYRFSYNVDASPDNNGVLRITTPDINDAQVVVDNPGAGWTNATGEMIFIASKDAPFVPSVQCFANNGHSVLLTLNEFRVDAYNLDNLADMGRDIYSSNLNNFIKGNNWHYYETPGTGVASAGGWPFPTEAGRTYRLTYNIDYSQAIPDPTYGRAVVFSLGSAFNNANTVATAAFDGSSHYEGTLEVVSGAGGTMYVGVRLFAVADGTAVTFNEFYVEDLGIVDTVTNLIDTSVDAYTSASDPWTTTQDPLTLSTENNTARGGWKVDTTAGKTYEVSYDITPSQAITVGSSIRVTANDQFASFGAIHSQDGKAIAATFTFEAPGTEVWIGPAVSGFAGQNIVINHLVVIEL